MHEKPNERSPTESLRPVQNGPRNKKIQGLASPRGGVHRSPGARAAGHSVQREKAVQQPGEGDMGIDGGQEGKKG